MKKKRTKKAIEESNDIRRRIEEIEVRTRASEQSREQSDQARQRAEQRTAKLEEMLRRMGVDPDTVLDDVNVSQGASAGIGKGSGAGV